MPDIKRKALKTAIGVDVGIINAVAVSDGTIVKSPKLLGGYSDKISVLGRRMDKKEVGSENWKKAAARLSKQHSKVANKRDDFLHKLSKQLVQKADVVIFEKLNIRNMQKLHSLARSIEDAGWYKLMEYTAYKAEDAGGYVCFVDASGTTQLCSKCGVTVRKSSSERLHSCPTCGFSADRDLNASLNILRRLRTDGVKLCKMPVETEPPRSRRREREHGRRSRTPERDDVTSIFIRREKVQP
jgi:putative transposase